MDDREEEARSRKSLVGSATRNGRPGDECAPRQSAQPGDEEQAAGETSRVGGESSEPRTAHERDCTDGAVTAPAEPQRPDSAKVAAPVQEGRGVGSDQASCSASSSEQQGAAQEAAVSVSIVVSQESEPGGETVKAGDETTQAGDETVKAGDETEQAGDETVKAGDETKQAGDETVKAGDETEQEGDETVKAGDETKQAGDETVKAGDETEQAGDETVKAGDETEQAGDETVKAGDETKQAGDETVKAGDETEQEGDETVKAGDETVKAGDETVKAGDETVKAGDETVKAGDETVKAGDETEQAGDETKQAGDETVKAGDETEQAGDETKQAGDESVKVGESPADSAEAKQEAAKDKESHAPQPDDEQPAAGEGQQAVGSPEPPALTGEASGEPFAPRPIRSQDDSIIQTSSVTPVSCSAPAKGEPSEQAQSPAPKAATVPRVTSSATTWYCRLDSEQNTWALAGGDSGSPQDKAAARKSNSDEDQLMALCKSVNSSRLSIVGYPLLNGPDRLRAMSSANKDKPVSQNILRLRALERSLKVSSVT